MPDVSTFLPVPPHDREEAYQIESPRAMYHSTSLPAIVTPPIADKRKKHNGYSPQYLYFIL